VKLLLHKYHNTFLLFATMDAIFGSYDLDEYMLGNDEDSDIGSLLEWGSDGLVYEGSLVSSLAPSTSESEIEVPPWVSDAEVFGRHMSSAWQQVPVSPEMSMNALSTIQALTDDDLMSISPTLLTHMLRTEAHRGVQIISPRQVPLGSMAGRVFESKRQPDTHLVGSNAIKGLPWPVAAGHILTNLWYREPLDAGPNTPAVRHRVAQESLVPATNLLSDPVSKAIVKSRALVDLQRRADVGGDSDALGETIAAAWGVDAGIYDDSSGAMIGGTGNLLRYAIGPDKHFPVLHAPVQARKVISVAAMATGRDIYGEFSALDWRRLRVLCEAVFYISARTEGHTMEDMALTRPVGDPSTRIDRAGIMQFRPLPGAIWSFEPSSFAVRIARVPDVRPQVLMPHRIAQVLEDYLADAPLVVHAEHMGAKISYATAQVQDIHSSTRETLIAGFQRVVRTSAAFQTKGYTSSSAARGFIFQCIENNVSGAATEAAWVTRAVADAASSLGIAHAVDAVMARQTGVKLGVLTDDLRQKMVVEAERRSETLEEWWDDFAAQLPIEIRSMEESNSSWASGIAWCLMARPNSRWIALSTALAHETHRALANVHLMSCRLPGILRSNERIQEAASIALRRLSQSYGTYYHATTDACHLLSGRMKRAGDKEAAAAIRMAGLLWNIRAQATSTLSISFNNDQPSSSVMIRGARTTASVSTAPYAAYERWRSAAAALKVEMSSYPKQLSHKVSSVFKGKVRPMLELGPYTKARVMRYVACPELLYRDIEKTIKEVCASVKEVIERYESEGLEEMTGAVRDTTELEIRPVLDLKKFKPAEGTFWDLIKDMDQYDAVWIVELLEEVSQDVADRLTQGRYRDAEALLVVARSEEAVAASRGVPEAIN
jgi:hypothetical protein